jgi:hypothetical protein
MLGKLLLVMLALGFTSNMLQAQQTARDMAAEKTIWDQLQPIAPGAVADFRAATTALDEGKYDEAVRLYEAVRKKAPDFDPVLRRLGYAYAAQGKLDQGLPFLEQAVANHRSAENLLGLAEVLAYPGQNKEGTREQKARALALVVDADRMPKAGDDVDYQLVLAQLALDLDQVELFRRATEKLVAKHPELMVTHYFNALLAANDAKWGTAETEILKAESLGLPHETVQSFLDSGVDTKARVWRYALYAIIMVLVWMVGLTLLFLVGKFMSRKTLYSIETGDPNAVATRSELSLRKWYRLLITIGGLYYYISIPVVMFLVIAVAASVTYGFLLLGEVPIKIVAILCIGAVITVYKMVRSLFVKIEKEDPGRSLVHDEAPGLWDLTRKIAEAVNTRPIDEIRITTGTDLAVYEKGTFRERSKDKAKRILILGVGVLNGFELNGFRAVLAHEYGHFSHRDTAGGDIALRVNDHMMKFAHAMALSGQAVSWNVAFQFLRVYHFIFRRISHGATRLQEVLADRVAAAKYGAKAFEDGLTHVVRKTAEFSVVATREIKESATSRRVLQNIYEITVAENADIEEEARRALNRDTSEDDTHPSPVDRFRFTSRIVSHSEPPLSGEVWDLFRNRAAITTEMTSLIQIRLQQLN